MAEINQTTHVVFSMSAAETLREALPMLGATGRVVGLPDIFSIGPYQPA